MPQPGEHGDRDERREWIAAARQQMSSLRQQTSSLQRLIDAFEAEMAREAGEDRKRRRFRLIRGGGAIAAVFLTLRRALLHVHGTTTAAILTAAASGALITAAAVTAPASNAPSQPGPGVTVTESAPATRAAHAMQPTRPAAPQSQPAQPGSPTSIPSGIPDLLPSSPPTPTGPMSPTPLPTTITPAVPTPAVVVQPPSRRRRRRPIKVPRARLCSGTDWTVMTKICTV